MNADGHGWMSAGGQGSKKQYLLLAKIQLWLAQTKNNVWSIEAVQSDGIMDKNILIFRDLLCNLKNIFSFAAQMD